ETMSIAAKYAYKNAVASTGGAKKVRTELPKSPDAKGEKGCLVFARDIDKKADETGEEDIFSNEILHGWAAYMDSGKDS
ncbi:hypothetical protein C0991_004973, partial [Blastosporella zonata]